MSAPLSIASFKLQFGACRARIVPAFDENGQPFVETGIDLVSDEAMEALALSIPMRAWLEAREPLRVRSLSFDLVRGRLLVTADGTPRPRVIRIDREIDSGSIIELAARAAPLLVHLGSVAREKLANRRR